MQRRFIEKAGEWTSLLGFGCMRFPWKGDKVDQETVQKMVDYAKSHGVNYFDTAYVYGDGASERSIGKALSKYPRDSYFLADKLPEWIMKSPSDADRLFDESLERLGTDYIDFYLLHSLDVDNWEYVKKYNCIDWIKKKKEEGKVKHIGFSFHDSPELFREIADSCDWVFAQIQLNYLDWTMQKANEIYSMMEERSLSCIVMEPIRGGALANPPEDVLKLLKSEEPEKTPASWALRFCASHPLVKVILSGMSDFNSVVENVNTLSSLIPLDSREFETLKKASDIIMKAPNIPCTGCRYCMPCPKGVNIQLSFRTYNDFMKFHNKALLGDLYYNALNKEGPDLCIRCGACVKKCPQHIDIPNELPKVDKLFKDAGFKNDA